MAKKVRSRVLDTPEASTSKAQVAVIEKPESFAEDSIKVNNASLTQLKNACDDFIKEHYSRPDAFKPLYQNENIHLALGWSSCLVAGAMSAYGYFVPFKESRNWIIVGVVLYALLGCLSWLHQNHMVKYVVFEGKRKTISSRIETQKIVIASKILPKPITDPPLLISVKYTLSANSGKSVLNSSEGSVSLSFGEVFDSEGNMHKAKFEEFLDGLERDVVGGAS